MSPLACDQDGRRTSAESAGRQSPAGPSTYERGIRLPVEKPTKPSPSTVTVGSAKLALEHRSRDALGLRGGVPRARAQAGEQRR